MELQIDLKFSGNNVILPKYYMAVPCFADVQQYYSQKLCLFLQDFVYKNDIFRTAPGADDDVATTTCILGFPCHLSFLFPELVKNKWKFTHNNFLAPSLKIMGDITKLHELSEQPTYVYVSCQPKLKQ